MERNDEAWNDFPPLSPLEKGLTEVYGDIGILLSGGRLTFQRRGE